MAKPTDITGLKVTVMGLGLNGGGVATAKFFAEHGAQVTVTDMKSEKDLAKSLDELRGIDGLRFVLGRHDIADFADADLVIKNPAVKREGNKFLAAAKKIESDISVFLKYNPAPILAVTGSKGKSSTVSALHYGLKACGYDAFLGGNITRSPLSFLHKLNEHTPVVLELSSFQLADLKNNSDFHPHIVIITPIVPDHQNWYADMESYVADKKVIYQNQTAKDFTVCNADDPWGLVFAKETNGQTVFYSGAYRTKDSADMGQYSEGSTRVYFNEAGEGILESKKKEYRLLPCETKVLSFPLKQNVLNAALALYLYGVDPAIIPPIMKDYPGIEHRLELCHECGSLQFYNDSAATVPEACIAALEAFTAQPQQFEKPILIAGGTNKNLHFERFAEAAKMAAHIYLLAGTATERMTEALRKKGVPFFGPFDSPELLLNTLHNDLSGSTNSLQAVSDSAGIQNNKKKIPIVFSPACASFGMFKNEFDRGNTFKFLVKKIF